MAFGMTNQASAARVIDVARENTENPAWTSWPSRGYFPDALEPKGRWSLSSGNANTDFRTATVTVSRNGVAVPVKLHKVPVYPDNHEVVEQRGKPIRYGMPTLAWDLPKEATEYAIRSGVYTVTVNNIKSLTNSQTTSHTYNVRLFTPY